MCEGGGGGQGRCCLDVWDDGRYESIECQISN